jgi:4-hydroxy-2-oxoheptanedioate aldolase
MSQSDNPFKVAISEGELKIGVWCSLASALTSEVVAGCGADWLLIDTEHSPNDLRSVVAQLQAVAAYPPEPLVRVADDDPVKIKRFMDGGARSLMIPNISSAEQAREIVRATRYAPDGIRGFSASHRANRFGRVAGYHKTANANVFLAVQIECAVGAAAASEIAAQDGVDALFVGPGDLSTNLGAMGNPNADHVQTTIRGIIDAALAADKVAGILAPAKADADRYIEWGCRLVAVGSDLNILAAGTDALVAQFRH